MTPMRHPQRMNREASQAAAADPALPVRQRRPLGGNGEAASGGHFNA